MFVKSLRLQEKYVSCFVSMTFLVTHESRSQVYSVEQPPADKSHRQTGNQRLQRVIQGCVAALMLHYSCCTTHELFL